MCGAEIFVRACLNDIMYIYYVCVMLLYGSLINCHDLNFRYFIIVKFIRDVIGLFVCLYYKQNYKVYARRT